MVERRTAEKAVRLLSWRNDMRICGFEGVEGCVFDFNGTLLFDTPAHADAWREFLREEGIIVSDADIQKHIQGRPNPDILRHFFGELTDEKIRTYAERKEEKYRAVCLRHPEWFRLVDGVAQMFDWMRGMEFPFTIATSSQWGNVSFYFEHLGLDRWFTPESIVFDNGKMAGKPAPDIYLKAMQLIDCRSEKCMVFEDSLSGIRSGHAAGAGWIIAVDSDLDREMLQQIESVSGVISDFRTVLEDSGKK